MAYTARYGTTGATAPHFLEPHGTIDRVAPMPAPVAPSETSVRVAEWLASDDARRFDHQWVLLDDLFRVVDNDVSAAALTERHSERNNPLVVFVQRPRFRLG
jgi:hypothetical protein